MRRGWRERCPRGGGWSETMSDQAQLDQLCINTIRTLSIDAVQQAQSGHPGTPMGAAPTVYCLWQRFLRYDPDAPNWPNRDRFVLSAGHASTLLYSVLLSLRRQGDEPDLRASRPACRDARRYQELPSGRQPVHRPPGIRLDLGRGDDHGAARTGGGERASAWQSRSAGWRPPTTAPATICSTITCMPCAAMAT